MLLPLSFETTFESNSKSKYFSIIYRFNVVCIWAGFVIYTADMISLSATK